MTFVFGWRVSCHFVSIFADYCSYKNMEIFKISSVLFLFLFLDLTSALYFHIAEGERKCFIEEIPDDTTVIGEEWSSIHLIGKCADKVFIDKLEVIMRVCFQWTTRWSCMTPGRVGLCRQLLVLECTWKFATAMTGWCCRACTPQRAWSRSRPTSLGSTSSACTLTAHLGSVDHSWEWVIKLCTFISSFLIVMCSL